MHNPIYTVSYTFGLEVSEYPIIIGFTFNREQAQKVSDHLETFYDRIRVSLNNSKRFDLVNKLHDLLYNRIPLMKTGVLPAFGARVRFHVKGPFSYLNENEIRGSFDLNEIKDFFWEIDTPYGENKYD